MAREARADETDNFTCHSRPMRDALEQLDALMNARIRTAVARANHRAGARCDAACLERVAVDELRDAIGSSYRPLPSLIPHSRFMQSVSDLPDLDRCHLRFNETIYGARSYNRPWMYPFHRRIIFVADSIRLANRIVGLDKMNHFIREGLVHWRAVNEDGGTIASDIARELGSPRQHTAWTEQGLDPFGMGIGLSTGDVAAAMLGSDERIEYTVVGDTVNLAQRLQDLARPAGMTVLSQATVDALGSQWTTESMGDHAVKGREQPVAAYRLMSGAG